MAKNSKSVNVIKVIVICVVATLIYLFISCLIAFSTFFKTIKENSHKEETKYYADYDNRLESEDIINKLSNKYNNEFDIISVTKENLEDCESTWLDSYVCKDILVGEAFSYKYVIKSKENIYFNLKYKDPYYIEKYSDKMHIEYIFEDDYVEWVKINEPASHREMVNRLTNYYNEEFGYLGKANIYYFGDEINGPNHIKLYVETPKKLDSEDERKIKNYFSNNYSDIFNSSCDQTYGKYFCDYDIIIKDKSGS